MENIKIGFQELWKPTERAFKGLAIVFSIYSAATFICLLIVSQLTEAHLRYAKQQGDTSYDPNGEI